MSCDEIQKTLTLEQNQHGTNLNSKFSWALWEMRLIGWQKYKKLS
jgi:hypothetical protein